MLTNEQMALRLGKICASSVYKLMKPKGLGDGGRTYLWGLIAERETGENEDVPTSFAMQWGIDHEAEAGAYYAQCKCIEIMQGDSISFGEIIATPDYTYISDSESYGIEIKCPHNSAKHAQRLRYNDYKDIKKNNPDYYWQMVAGMVATGFKKWVFLSYDPRFIEPSKRMVAITVPYIEDDVELFMKRISESIHFFVDNGVKGLEHKHADFYKFLKESEDES